MFEKLEIVRMAQALAQHAGARQGIVARNIAHADTPGYKAQDLPDFAAVVDGGALRATRKGHLATSEEAMEPRPRATGGGASPDGNTVSLEREMVTAAGIRQQHEMALAIYRNSADIIRASLGRS
jgi:flagellar basal-body rod protein FlgB